MTKKNEKSQAELEIEALAKQWVGIYRAEKFAEKVKGGK